MAETTTNAHEPEQLTERWKCMACAEPWDLIQGASAQRCPECGGPLRLVPGRSAIARDPASRLPVALNEYQQRPVVHGPGAPTPWAGLKHLDATSGSLATDEHAGDTGHHAGALLNVFQASQHERLPIRLVHTAAD